MRWLLLLLLHITAQQGGYAAVEPSRTTTRFCVSVRDGKSEQCLKLRLQTALKSGLFNQHLTLLSFLTLGIASGASELQLVHSERRRASIDDKTWEGQPFDTLWDASKLQTFLQGHRVHLLLGQQASHHHVHPVADFPKLNYADIGDAVTALQTHVSNELLQSADLLERDGDVTTIEVGTPGMFRALATGISHLHTDVARHTQFAPNLLSIADECIKRMTGATVNATYSGVHLRVEDDFGATERLGGREAMLVQYYDAIKHLGIDPTIPLYISSGIFRNEPDFAQRCLGNWSNHIYYNEILLTKSEMAQLDIEQLAAVDFLITARAAKFIGWAGSSFSFWIPEHRVLHGMDPSSSYIIRGDWANIVQDEFTRSNAVLRT